MPTEHIIALLVEERDKLNRAIEALGRATKRPGRSGKSRIAAPTKKHHMRSAAARKAQAERMKAYWAKRKKAAK